MTRSILFASFLLLNHLCFSQGITILSSDLTSVGDQIKRYVDTIPAYGPGGAGANQVWDFSAAVREDSTLTNVVATSSTPYNSTFSNSSYAMTGDANSYLYFTHTISNLYTDGAAGDLLGTGEIIVTPFTDDLVLHVFPRNYGNYFSDTYEFQAQADGSSFTPPVYRVRLSHSGIVYDTTDGYGTLITPTGTYEALRVKTTAYTESFVETQAVQFLPIWLPLTTIYDTAVVYSWHAKEEMLAIAEFTYDSIGNPKQFVFSTVPPVLTTGVSQSVNNEGIAIYPQPASGMLYFRNANENALVEVFSINGSLVKQTGLTGNSLSVADLKAGMYLLRYSSADGVNPKTLKFIVE